jgi:hypothetical protein
VDQDRECAKELDKCLDSSEVNRDLVVSLKSVTKREKAMWFGFGFGVGSLVISGIVLGALFGRR